jgi:hypothetical protein
MERFNGAMLDGAVGGEQITPAGWVRAATAVSGKLVRQIRSARRQAVVGHGIAEPTGLPTP